jgi:hypothetical protein
MDEALRIAKQFREMDDVDRAIARIAIARAEQGDVDEAFVTLERLSDAVQRQYALREIANAYVRAGVSGAWKPPATSSTRMRGLSAL